MLERWSLLRCICRCGGGSHGLPGHLASGRELGLVLELELIWDRYLLSRTTIGTGEPPLGWRMVRRKGNGAGCS
jgi:hypothetical protein